MKKRIVTILIIMLIPLKANALTGETSLNCNKDKVIKGETITCNLKGTISDDSAEMYEGTINIEEQYFELVSVTPSSIMSMAEANNAHMLYIIENPIGGEYDIATFVIKVKDTISDAISAQTNISIVEQRMTGVVDTQGKNISNKLHNIKINSTNNKLSSITLSDGTISPEFNADTNAYTATVDAATVTVSATAASTASQITGSGEKELEYGTNTVQITVTPEQGIANTYTLSITRKDNRNSECNINNIEFYNYDIKFNKSNTNYNIDVKDTVESLEIGDNEVCQNDKILCIKRDSIDLDNNAEISEISLNGNSRSTIPSTGHGYSLGKLNKGENILNITVTAENNDTKIYKFTINRIQEEDKNSSKPSESSTTDGKIANPKTGSSFVYSIILILIVSFSIVYYYYKKNNVERKNNAK